MLREGVSAESDHLLLYSGGGNACRKGTAAQAVSLISSGVRTRIIGYIWDSTAPIGRSARGGRCTGNLRDRTLRIQAARQMDHRAACVLGDRRIDGETALSALAPSIASDDARSNAAASIGPIGFARADSGFQRLR